MRFGNVRKKSNQVAVDWAFDLKTVSDPNKDQPAEKLVQNVIYFILNGVSPVKEAQSCLADTGRNYRVRPNGVLLWPVTG
jgi:hypothetical protein